MTKALRKATMTRSTLKNVYLKNQNTTNWNNYKYQRNFCTNPLLKTKFIVKALNDNKKFLKKIKTFFSNKGLASSKIVLKEKGDLITDNQKLASFFNTYFTNITDNLNKITLKISISL